MVCRFFFVFVFVAVQSLFSQLQEIIKFEYFVQVIFRGVQGSCVYFRYGRLFGFFQVRYYQVRVLGFFYLRLFRFRFICCVGYISYSGGFVILGIVRTMCIVYNFLQVFALFGGRGILVVGFIRFIFGIFVSFIYLLLRCVFLFYFVFFIYQGVCFLFGLCKDQFLGDFDLVKLG